ncbi:hypothetical protein EC988_000687 [Linderina pennispora]|nr:hypothetical protein EC988_000687 [Linderina pennispora]
MSSNSESRPHSPQNASIAAHHYSETADFQRMCAQHEEALTQGVSKVLVIYTGGTIGMKHDDVLGYHPVKGYLPEKLRSIGRFHDPNGFDDFDLEFQRTGMHTGNTRAAPTGRKSGNASGMASRVLVEQARMRLKELKRGQSRPNSTVEDQPVERLEGLHLVDEPGKTEERDTAGGPDGQQQGLSVSDPDSSDPRGTGTPGRLSEWLITPRSMYGRRVQYCFLEYDPLLDSCNMDMTDWVRIVTDIEKFYYMFDAFIILHGTDTMAYTAGALSFMLQNLGKSVIVTGSQVPIAEVRNDGIENFLGALTVAGHFVIPEVTLYFSNKLFRGNRCVKIDAMDFEAFGSPNLAPLVKVGVDIEVNWPEVLRPNCIMPFCAHKQMNCNVATLRLFPGISAAAIRAFLAPPIQGIVLETFGAGNAPDTRPNILEALAEASERGVVIVNVTQCQRGNVSDLYATARGLTNARVVPGRDMTSECALTKLSYLLGRGFSPDKCRDMLSRSLRGELTIVQSHKRPIFSSGHVRSNTFAQFVARQILDETQANEADLEPPAMPMSPSIGSGESDLPVVARTQSEAESRRRRSPMQSRETVTERASIYRSFFPVLLCTAAATGDLQGMYLLESASNNFLEVTCYDYTGQTPLHCAVRAGQLPCARFLLKRGASVHVLSRMGHTPLFAAILSRHPEMVQLLVNAGAHFSDAETKDLMVSMQNAVTRGDIEFVKLAVRAGFNLDCTDYEGRTVLFFAVIAGQVEIVQYLLLLPNITVEIWDQWGYSPLDYVLRKLDLWREMGAPHEDSVNDMQLICNLFYESLAANTSDGEPS